MYAKDSLYTSERKLNLTTIAIIHKVDQLLDHFEELITFFMLLGETLRKSLKQRNLIGKHGLCPHWKQRVTQLTDSFHTSFLMAIPISFIIIFLWYIFTSVYVPSWHLIHLRIKGHYIFLSEHFKNNSSLYNHFIKAKHAQTWKCIHQNVTSHSKIVFG